MTVTAVDAGKRRGAMRVVAIAGAGALALGGAGFLLWLWAIASSNDSPPPVDAAMAALPEASLVYPNATNTQEVGQGSECRDGFWLPDLIEYKFTTRDPTHDVFFWYSERLGQLGWRGDVPSAGATGYSLTRDTDDLFEIQVNLNPDGSPYQIGDSGTQFTTDFQHSIRSGRC